MTALHSDYVAENSMAKGNPIVCVTTSSILLSRPPAKIKKCISTRLDSNVVVLEHCAAYSDCQKCVADRGCGYFTNTGVCVPGGWLRARANYTDHGDSWSYYHGQCYIGTRIEFVLLPIILGLVILGAAMVALWRHRWPVRWRRSDDGDYSSCASSVVGPAVEGQRRHPHHHGDEHMPLLIDNDPYSLPAASRRQHRRRSSLVSDSSAALAPADAGMSIEARRHQAGHSWAVNTAPAGSSFEEHYGSWCQRNVNMVQNAAPNDGK